MIKRIFYWASTLLQMLILIVAYGIQVFSMKKMGMMRYVVFMNHEWETRYPIALIRYFTVALMLILVMTSISYFFLKSKHNSTCKNTLPILAANVIIALVFVFFTSAYSTASFRSYYFICLGLGAAALIQHMKVFIYLSKIDCSKRLII